MKRRIKNVQPARKRAASYTLVGADGEPFASARRGTLGGHRKTKIFGRLDCRAALAALLRGKGARGGYVTYRVFFANAADAIGAGFRPCAVCLPDEYAKWKVSSRRAG